MTLAELIPSLRTSCYARLERGIWPDSAQASCAGALAVGGVELADLARRFGTPLYVLDTEQVRARMLAYRTALPSAEVAYAGKALLTKALVRLAAEAGLSLDVCSGGEVALAVAAGFPPERMLLHGNVKTDEELRSALKVGVGRIVLDSVDDIDRLGELARQPQRVMVRLTPGVDGQTHPALATGVEDQKFGVAIDQIDTVRRVSVYPHLRLVGLHCHIGSQIADVSHYQQAAVRMVEAMGKAEPALRHGPRGTESRRRACRALPRRRTTPGPGGLRTARTRRHRRRLRAGAHPVPAAGRRTGAGHRRHSGRHGVPGGGRQTPFRGTRLRRRGRWDE